MKRLISFTIQVETELEVWDQHERIEDALREIFGNCKVTILTNIPSPTSRERDYDGDGA